MTKEHLQLGRSGEDLAVDRLRQFGYTIIQRNYKTKLGEIDIVALDKDTYCFVEVKTRRSEQFGLPQESVSAWKQKQIAKAALGFLKERNLFDKKARFDIVSILYSGDTPRLDIIKDAFTLDERFTY